MSRKSLAARISGLALACALPISAPAAAADPSLVRIRTGALKGVVEGDLVVFKGIPFAAPPVGDLRWRPPQPVPPWTGVRDAAAFGPICLQSGGLFAGTASQSEDCLTLNVWAPAAKPAKPLPVMVWIHGGGFVGGSGSQPYYDGSAFARDGVILVSLNYRLGRLGFFAHPAIDRQHPEELHADYGLMDQIAALKWVRANIAAFGGDPNNVTAFGESAGGISVNFLMTSPEAKGLFQKAISESGFGRFDPPPQAIFSAAEVTYAQSLGVEGTDAAAAAALRALPADKLLGGFNGLLDPGIPRPILDGRIIKERVDVAFAAGRQAKIPYIVGGNSYEASLFAPVVAAHPDATLAPVGGADPGILKLFGDGQLVPAALNVSTESLITEPDRDLAAMDAKAGTPAYLYYFSYVAKARRGSVPGAGHGSELVFVFETLPTRPMTIGGREIPAAAPEDLAEAAKIHSAWVSFAKTGRPVVEGGLAWPAYDPAADPTLVFSESGVEVKDHFLKDRLDLLQKVAERRAAATTGS